VLPDRVMQPLWESVKKPDGNWPYNINFRLNYHRANYEPAYDDYHDIYLQRWRLEDRAWHVVCINKVTKAERNVEYGVEHLNFDGEVCHDPTEYKVVYGQSNPLLESTAGGAESKFLNSSDPVNSWWKPDSVPSVQAQPWSANYEDGNCGIRKLNEDFDSLDPEIANREQGEGRGECSNAVDNPVHSTTPDKLIGRNKIVERRRAKFVAISKLTDDYLDTCGILKTFEGELEGEQELVKLMKSDAFGMTSGDEIGSTYAPQVFSEFKMAKDFDTRMHQYEENFNDRAKYSLSCVLDGSCSVNFKDQVEDYSGHV
jgi:hypothetical protein